MKHNKNQKKAITTTEGYVRVDAGAGTGKTATLVARYIHLVRDLGIQPEGILCVTFTNKAANEMKKRIGKEIPGHNLGLISTFHGFCVRILREDGHRIYLPKNFQIADERDVNDDIKRIMSDFGYSSRDTTVEAVKKEIHRFKRDDPRYYTAMTAPNIDYIISMQKQADNMREKIIWEFLYHCKLNEHLDFDDLIYLAYYILITFDEVKDKWQKRLQYIMTDEFQDVSDRQYMLVSLLSEYHKNLYIVGDADQTIYTWRGADADFFVSFDCNFCDCKTITLDQNYRSVQPILDCANQVIRNNVERLDKTLVAVKTGGERPKYYHAKTVTEESNFVTKEIQRLHAEGIEYDDIGILFRTALVTKPLEEALMQARIPYIFTSGTAFYNRREVKTAISYLQLIANGDDTAFLRVYNTPTRGIGKKKIDAIKNYAKEHHCKLYDAMKELVRTNPEFARTKARYFIRMIDSYSLRKDSMPLGDLVEEVLNYSGYEEDLKREGNVERLMNISELKQTIVSFEKVQDEPVTLQDFLNHIALYYEEGDDAKSAVKLSTIHGAKGLEYPVAFVFGMSEGVFPSSKANTEQKMEEERRLAYVAFTRAEDKLYLTDSEGFVPGEGFKCPSRFIFEAEDTIEHLIDLPDDLLEETKRSIRLGEVKENTFRIGDRVFHKKIGIGIIVGIDKQAKTWTVKFDDSTERTISWIYPLEEYDEVAEMVKKAKKKNPIVLP